MLPALSGIHQGVSKVLKLDPDVDHKSPRAFTQQAFEHVDKDSSGEIEIQELEVAMYQFGFDHTPEQFLATFKAFDRDGNGRIDASEQREVRSCLT